MPKKTNRIYQDQTAIKDRELIRRLRDLADDREIKTLSRLATQLCRERLDQLEYGTIQPPADQRRRVIGADGEIVVRVKLE